jgi:hypothetical protein
MKEITKQSLMKNDGILDKLWRSVGKEGAKCEICESLPVSERVNYSKLDPHHIIKRGHKATRWLLENRIWVCSSHHTLGRKTVEYNESGWFWGDKNDWLGAHRPKDKAFLEKKKHEVKQWTYDELYGLYCILTSLR